MPKNTEVKKTRKELEKERLAKALRENLKKRKEKQRSPKGQDLVKSFFFGLIMSVAPIITVSAADLTVTSWGGSYQEAQRDIFLTPFSTSSGKKIAEASYNGGLDEIESHIKADTAPWDVIEVEASDLYKGCQQKYFDLLNWQKIGQRADFVRGTHHNCGVGSVIWAMVLAFDDTKFPEAKPQNWADFFDVEKFPGKRALRKTAKTTLEIALMAAGAKGKDVYSLLRSPQGIEKAFEQLDKILPHLMWWEKGSEPVDLLTRGNAELVAAYNGRIAEAISRGYTLAILWQDAFYSSDYWALLGNSKNKDAAYQFLRFISKPNLQAQLSERMYYAPTLTRAYKLIGRDKGIHMPDFKTKGRMMVPIDEQFWAQSGQVLEKKFQEWLKKR